ncbi:nucleotidyltransferase family protein [Aliikangiella maris]
MNANNIETNQYPHLSEITLLALLNLPKLNASQIEQCNQLIQHVDDFDNLLAKINYHRTWPCTYLNIKQYFTHLFPSSFLERLAEINRKINYKILDQTHINSQILSALEKNKISAVTLKGYPLAKKLFGNITKRYAKDLDLLIDEKDILKAYKTVKALGFRALPYDDFDKYQREKYLKFIKDIVLYKGNQVVELHVRLNNDSSLLSQQLTPKLLNQTNDEYDELIYICAHASHSIFHRIKWLTDIVLLIQLNTKSQSFCLQKLISKATAYGELNALICSWVLVSIIYRIALPIEISSIFNHNKKLQLVINQYFSYFNNLTKETDLNSILNQLKMKLILTSNLTEKIKYLSFYLKPTTADFISFRLRSNKLFFLYYLFRPFRLINRHLLNNKKL